MIGKGRIATAQDRSLHRVREARKLLVRAEAALVEGKFRTASGLIENAMAGLPYANMNAKQAYEGLVETQRPT